MRRRISSASSSPTSRIPSSRTSRARVEDVAYRNNFAVLLCNYDEDPKKEHFYFDVMQSESVDGIILPPIHETDPAVLQAAQNSFPVVCVDPSLLGGYLDTVEADHHTGAFQAA